MSLYARLAAIIGDDPLRMDALAAARALGLPDGWIGGGFVRDAVWDRLHGYPVTPPAGDVDMLFHDPATADEARERALEDRLRQAMPDLDWSVKNQARMHRRNGDAPYADVAEAMRHWPEMVTAVAVRLSHDNRLEINAPFGLEPLFALELAPGPHFTGVERPVFDARVADKRWMARYPRLVLRDVSPLR